MTTITQTPPPAFGSTVSDTTSTTTGPDATASAISSDFDTFLQMLTVQLQNQDPLNPDQATDFAVQLATFSTVEQQVLTNDLLSGLGSQMNVMGLSQLASWVGMEARANVPVQFDGSAPVTLFPQPDRLADSATLLVRDEQGVVVQSKPLNLPVETLEWDGMGDDGTPLPAGLYTMDLESFSNGESLGFTQVESYNRVTEARVEGNETILILQGGQSVPANAIKALREASAI